MIFFSSRIKRKKNRSNNFELYWIYSTRTAATTTIFSLPSARDLHIYLSPLIFVFDHHNVFRALFWWFCIASATLSLKIGATRNRVPFNLEVKKCIQIKCRDRINGFCTRFNRNVKHKFDRLPSVDHYLNRTQPYRLNVYAQYGHGVLNIFEID